MTRKNPSLDGLRCIAVALVVGYHAGAPGFGSGWVGVDVFLVISGFLITTLLADEAERAGRIDLPRFWGRRFLRLMPLYLAYVSVVTAMMVLGPDADMQTKGAWTPQLYIASLWLYFVNFSPGEMWIWQHDLTGHLWSLALEEQFYFVWPPLLALTVRRRFAPVLWTGVALALTVHLLSTAVVDYQLLHHRGISILIGCCAALLATAPRAPLRPGAGAARALAWTGGAGSLVCLVAIGLVQSLRGVPDPYMLRGWVPALDAFVGALLVGVWLAPDPWVSRALAFAPLVYVGEISYGIYIYHLSMHWIVWTFLLPGLEAWPGYARFGLRMALFVALSVAVAALSYRWFELPFLRFKERLRPAA